MRYFKKPMFRIILALVLGGIVLSLCLVLKPAGPSLSGILPGEINYNNDGRAFWAADGCFYYLQDVFYNMGVYRSEGGTAKRIFRSSDFDDPEFGSGDLGQIFPCDGRLYFTARCRDVETMLYCYDPGTKHYAPVLAIEDSYRDWLICGDHLVLLGWSERASLMHSDWFWHQSVVAYDLRTGERTVVCENAEAIGQTGGELRYVSYDGEYELFRYDFESGQSVSMGRFPLVFEPGEFFSGYTCFSFSADGVAMYNHNRENYHSLVVYSASAGTLKTFEMPRGIHSLVVAGDSAFVRLYDLVEGNSSAVGSPENGLYRVSLSDGASSCLYPGTSGTLYVASEDCVFLIFSEGRVLTGPWRTVYQISPETGENVREFHI